MGGIHDGRDFSLPWGSWLTLDEDGVHDEHGNRWNSVRDALIVGRLKLSGTRDDEQFELLTTFLLAVSRGVEAKLVEILDLFGGSREYYRFYRRWLTGRRILADDGGANDRLTDEGRSILLMLAATRPFEKGPLPVGNDAMSAAPATDDSTGREAWFAEIAELAAKMPGRFLRREVGGRPMIVAMADGVGERMKLRRTLWSQAFGDAESRDTFHHWLCLRVHRWPDWIGDAWRGGQEELTARLLSLLAADLASHTVRFRRPVTVEGIA
jgi:hypothetical protein